ncbi:Transposase [Streptomyces sp. ScaeMP-e48]|nr:Transposase [Streptomyces sp. ScaeMP-e48]
MLTAGQRHDSVMAQALLERIRVPRTGPGRPRSTPEHVVADKAYSSRVFRAYLRRRGIIATIPEKDDQKKHRRNRGSHGGRPPGFDRETYRRRNTVERCFNHLKGFHGIATRYDKTATSYEAAVSLASFLLWARSFEDGPYYLSIRCSRLVTSGESRVDASPGTVCGARQISTGGRPSPLTPRVPA